MTALRSEWGGIRRWQERVTSAGRKLRAAPAPVRILAIAVIAFLGFFAINLFYHVLRKPTEIFAFVSANFNKAPAETWRQYGRLFREYSTAAISPELLAALAQVEGAGNPVARTYWRWQLSWNPLALYQPASSGVGMFQMTDAAFAEARQFCIRNHIVSQDACRLGWLIFACYRATRSSSRRFIWTAISKGFLRAPQPRSRMRSTKGNWPR